MIGTNFENRTYSRLIAANVVVLVLQLSGFVDETYALQKQVIAFQTNQAYDSLLVSLKHRQDLEEARKLSQEFLDKTQARYNAGTVAKLDVVESVVLAVVSDDFTLGTQARRWLDDDEFLVRRRIHRDLRALMDRS